MRARVETLERENQALRARVAALGNRDEARGLRRGRAAWLLTGLVASFFPLVAAPLFFSAPKAPWLARRLRAAPVEAPGARPAAGGERAGAFRGVALAAPGAPEAAPADDARRRRERERAATGADAPLTKRGAPGCLRGDPLCGGLDPADPWDDSKGGAR